MTAPLSILGTRVDNFKSFEEVVSLIRHRVISRVPTFCIAINPEKIYRAQRNPKQRRVLDLATVSICDGIGVWLAAWFLYRTNVARCTGIDLFMALLDLSEREGWKVFVLGASPQVNESACRTIQQRLPNLIVAGRQHGYFHDSDEVVHKINESGADLLFVAMGSPRQELWIGEQLANLKPTLCMGVGGSLDVLSGNVRRAPPAFRRVGLEWLFRLMCEPSRIRRQAALPLFAIEVLKAACR